MKKLNMIFHVGFLTSLIIGFTACGGDSNEGNEDEFSKVKKTNTSGLSDFELKHGFGPIKKEIKLNPIDPELAKTGEAIFESKCATCHKLDERYTGPAQRDVLQRVTPEFFLNMVLNPEENLEKHPHSKKMFLEYLQKMTNQNINVKDALALLEYFRVLDEELTKTKSNQN
ncbi:c-type cytochrome [Bacteroidota bacterium]